MVKIRLARGGADRIEFGFAAAGGHGALSAYEHLHHHAVQVDHAARRALPRLLVVRVVGVGVGGDRARIARHPDHAAVAANGHVHAVDDVHQIPVVVAALLRQQLALDGWRDPILAPHQEQSRVLPKATRARPSGKVDGVPR